MRWQVRAMRYEATLRGIRAGLAGDGSAAAWWAYNECDKALKGAEVDLADTDTAGPATAGPGD
jgi:hypothetical protein